MVGQCNIEIMPGLPPYGPPALPFSSTGSGMHSEGFVVRFEPVEAQEWVGNFQPGLSALHKVIAHPNGNHVIVIAGGTAYVVDPTSKQLVSWFGGQIEFIHELQAQNSLLVGNGLWFECVDQTGLLWRSKRVSWDGMRDISVTAEQIIGKGWCFDETWHDFQVSLDSGAAVGGGYTGP